MEIKFCKTYLKNIQPNQIKETLVQYVLSVKMCEELEFIMNSKKDLAEVLNYKEIESGINAFRDCLNAIEYRYIEKINITIKDNYLYLKSTYNSFIASAIAKGVKFGETKNSIKLTDFDQLKENINSDVVVKFEDKEDFSEIENNEMLLNISKLIQNIMINELNFNKGIDVFKLNNHKSIDKIAFPQNIQTSIIKVEEIMNNVKKKLEACDIEFLQNVNIVIDKLFDISRSDSVYLSKSLKMEKLTNNFHGFEVKYQRLSDIITKNQTNINQLNLKYKKYVKDLNKVKSEIEVVKERINQISDEIENSKNADEKYNLTITTDDLNNKLQDLQYTRSINKILDVALENKIDYFNTLNDALVIDIDNKIQQENKIVYNFKTFLPANSEIEKYKKLNLKIDNHILDITNFIKERKNDVTTKYDKLAYKILKEAFIVIKDLVNGFISFLYKNACANCLFNLPFLIRNKFVIKNESTDLSDKYLEVSEEKFFIEKKEKFEEKNRELLKICGKFKQYVSNMIIESYGNIEEIKELEYTNLVNHLTNLKSEVGILKDNYLDLNNSFNEKIMVMQDLLMFYIK